MLLAGLTASATGRGQQGPLDRFGGWKRLSFEKTAFFRLEKRDRWWFVTPEGHPFLALGLNHAGPEVMLQPYNREHWFRSFGAADAKDPRFQEGFRRRLEQDLDIFGFNSLGYHTSSRFWNPGRYPYIQPFRTVEIDHGRTPGTAEFHDVFSPRFEALCEKRAAELRLRELASDPFLMGYGFTDCPILTEVDAAPRQIVTYGAPRAGTWTWPRVLRNLPGQAPGKQAYVNLMKRRYGAIHAFNRVYERSFDSFGHLADSPDWRPASDPQNANETHDNEAFLREILDWYYRTIAAVIRRHDPHHLLFGDKLNGNTGTPDFVVAAAAKHVDLVFYQWYGHYGEQKARLDEWSSAAGKPLFNGDSTFSVPDRHMPHPNGPHSPTQEERAARMLEFARAAFVRPDFVGWHICGWIDTWNTMPGKAVRQHSGLQDPLGRRYEPVVQALKTFSQEMYGRRPLASNRSVP
jgi:hypothetical protein